MSSENNLLKVAIADGIARLTLAAPARRNAIGLAWCREFAAAARTLTADPAVRVILMQAEGDYFSVGGDLDEFVRNRSDLEWHVRRMAEAFHEGLLVLHRGPVPLVAAVSGLAAGGGFSLVLNADLVLAARSARFVSAYSSSGLSPDGGMSFLLPRIVGTKKAFELMALNPVLSAEQAQALGIVTQVHDNDRLAAEAEACARRLAALTPAALAALKRLMWSSPDASMAEQMDAEARLIAVQAASPETLAVLDAFLSRRRERG